MNGLMMDVPLTIASIVHHAERVHGHKDFLRSRTTQSILRVQQKAYDLCPFFRPETKGKADRALCTRPTESKELCPEAISLDAKTSGAPQ